MNQEDVAKAIVDLDPEGRGVFVTGNYIITAAHCIPPPVMDAGHEQFLMLTSDDYLIQVKTTIGKIIVTPYIIERIRDIAVLGALDNQRFIDEAEEFEEVCEQITPVKLWQEDMELFKPFPVYAYNLDRTWTKSIAKQCAANAPNLAIMFDEQIKSGASGGPIINENGELVGIISTSSIVSPGIKSTGPCPRPHMTLPAWIMRLIME